MVRPRTVLRFLLYLSLAWLVLAALYAGLPNYSRIDNGTDYATKVLKSGGKLTRVYEVDKYFSKSNAAEFANSDRRSHIALTFKIDQASDSLIICDTARVALTRPAELSPVQEQEQENDDFFYLETTPIVVSAPAGDTDGINLPWFETADSVLMFYFVHRDRAFVKLRVGFSQGASKLEVWPGVDNRPLQDDCPLLSLSIDSTENAPNHILTASVPPMSLSPSPAYMIRLSVLLILAPLTITALGIYMAIIFIIYAILNLFIRLFWVIAFSLLVCWIYKGRPSADDFVQEVLNDMSRILRRARDWFGGLLSRSDDEEQRLPLRNEKSMAEVEIENAAQIHKDGHIAK